MMLVMVMVTVRKEEQRATWERIQAQQVEVTQDPPRQHACHLAYIRGPPRPL